MNENDVFGLDSNIFAEGILERGFFPENVPPVFRVENFHEAAIPYLTTQTYSIEKVTSEPGIYSALKRGGARRVFSLPNPTFYIDTAVFLNTYRSELFENFM